MGNVAKHMKQKVMLFLRDKSKAIVEYANKHISEEPTVLSEVITQEKKSDAAEDARRYDVLAQDNDNLRKRNNELEGKLKVAEEFARRLYSQHNQQMSAPNINKQKELSQTVEELEAQHKRQMSEQLQTHQKELERMRQKFQTEIEHLKKDIQDRADKDTKVLRSELENEQWRNRNYAQTNASLRKMIDELTKQLSGLRRTSSEVHFIDEMLYVCGGMIRCEKLNHQCEDVTGIIDTIAGNTIKMTVRYCKECDLFFVRSEVFESYRNLYGTLLGQFVRKPDGMQLGLSSFSSEIADESILHMNGYNVNQTADLSIAERRKILTYAIESGIMSKDKIRHHLGYLIKINRYVPNKSVAVSRWQADLQWVNDYCSSAQEVVWLKGTAMYKYRNK